MTKKIFLRKFLFFIFLFILFPLAVYWATRQIRQIPFGDFITHVSHVSFFYLGVSFLSLVAISFIKTSQWQSFLPQTKKIKFSELYEVLSVMFMMANLVPWGQAFTVYHLGSVKKVGKTEAISVLTQDQAIGGIAKLALVLMAALFGPLPGWAKQGFLLTVICAPLFYCVLFWVAHKHQTNNSQEENLVKTGLKKWFSYLADWAHHLHVFRDYSKTISTTILAILGKVCEVAAVYFLQKGFGLDLSLWVSILITAAVNIATMLPLIPGNLGVHEGACFLVYQFVGLDPAQGMILSVFNHLMFFVGMVLPGYVVAVAKGIKLKEPLPPLSQAHEAVHS